MRPFGRVVTAAIGQAGANGAALLGFRTSFDVAYAGSAAGTATIKVWNVPDEVVLAAFAGPLPSVILTAGHLDADTGAPMPQLPLFAGDVTDYVIRRDGLDNVLEITGRSAGFAWQRARFVFTSPTPTAYAALIPLSVAQAGLVMRSLAPPIPVPLPLGAYVDQSFRTFMDRAVAATGSRWRVDGVFVDVWPAATPNPASLAAVFDPANTIGQPSAKARGIQIRGLLNGKLRPGSPFVVIGRVGSGTYVAREVKFTGDSGYAPDFYVDVTGELPV